MSLKLKITLGVMLFVAGFLLVRLSLFFKQSVQTASSGIVEGVSTPNNKEDPLLKDSDHDGIPDVKEAYYRTDPLNPDSDGDGYLDGEEVVAGTNSLVNEGKLTSAVAKTDNITNRLADRYVGGLLAGDLSPKKDPQKFRQGIRTLALAALDEASQTLNPSGADVSIGLSDNSKESQEEYLKKVSGLLEGPFLTAFMAQPQTLNTAVQNVIADRTEDASKIFQDQYNLFTSAYTSLLTVTAPPKWLNFHKQLLTIFQKIAFDYGAAIKISDDPILALTAISDLMRPFTEIQSSLLEELKRLLASEQLSIPDTPLFSVLNLLAK